MSGTLRRFLLAAMLIAIVPSTTFADMLVWDYSGNTTTSFQTFYRIADLYPVGTPFSIRMTIDSDSARLAGSYCSLPQSLYAPFNSVTLTLGDKTLTTSGGWMAVNHHFDVGCQPLSVAGPFAEFWFLNPWTGPVLNPEYPSSNLGMVRAYSFDPVWANGFIPATQPGRLGFAFALSVAQRNNFANGSASAAADLSVIPEPTSLLLFVTGLAGFGLRYRVRNAVHPCAEDPEN